MNLNINENNNTNNKITSSLDYIVMELLLVLVSFVLIVLLLELPVLKLSSAYVTETERYSLLYIFNVLAKDKEVTSGVVALITALSGFLAILFIFTLGTLSLLILRAYRRDKLIKNSDKNILIIFLIFAYLFLLTTIIIMFFNNKEVTVTRPFMGNEGITITLTPTYDYGAYLIIFSLLFFAIIVSILTIKLLLIKTTDRDLTKTKNIDSNLKKLKELNEQGLITDEEYNEKKRQILGL